MSLGLYSDPLQPRWSQSPAMCSLTTRTVCSFFCYCFHILVYPNYGVQGSKCGSQCLKATDIHGAICGLELPLGIPRLQLRSHILLASSTHLPSSSKNCLQITAPEIIEQIPISAELLRACSCSEVVKSKRNTDTNSLCDSVSPWTHLYLWKRAVLLLGKVLILFT